MQFHTLANIRVFSGAFEKLAAWAASPKMAGVYHDDPMQTHADKLRSEACLENISDIGQAKECSTTR